MSEHENKLTEHTQESGEKHDIIIQKLDEIKELLIKLHPEQ